MFAKYNQNNVSNAILSLFESLIKTKAFLYLKLQTKQNKMNYVLSGSLKIGSKMQNFTKTVDAKDEEGAKELLYTLFGSAHGTKRRQIKIAKVEKSKE